MGARVYIHMLQGWAGHTHTRDSHVKQNPIDSQWNRHKYPVKNKLGFEIEVEIEIEIEVEIEIKTESVPERSQSVPRVSPECPQSIPRALERPQSVPRASRSYDIF